MAVPRIMGILHVPMLLAWGTVFRFLAGLLGDLVAEGDHPFLGGTTSRHTSLRPFVFLLSCKGIFNALKRFE